MAENDVKVLLPTTLLGKKFTLPSVVVKKRTLAVDHLMPTGATEKSLQYIHT